MVTLIAGGSTDKNLLRESFIVNEVKGSYCCDRSNKDATNDCYLCVIGGTCLVCRKEVCVAFWR